MENLNLMVQNNSFAIVVMLTILNLFLLVMVFVLSGKISSLRKKYDFFTKGKEANIDQVLVETLKELESSKQELEELKKKHEALRERVKGCLQSIKMKRYDAFDAMGGELSYSILLEDENKDGLILTSIYGRDESRCYAKLVEKGKALNPLAEEEEELMK